MTDKDLVLRLKNKDEEAFNTLYAKYNRLVLFTVSKILENKEDADDVTNLTFEIVWNNISSHDENKSFKYWLLTIAKNEALKVCNERAKQKSKVDNITMIEEDKKNHEYDFGIEDIKKILTPLEFQIFAYHTIYNLNFVEIGNLLDKSKSSCHRIYQEAIEKLQTKI